jgi:hypothetical protein
MNEAPTSAMGRRSCAVAPASRDVAGTRPGSRPVKAERLAEAASGGYRDLEGSGRSHGRGGAGTGKPGRSASASGPA